jgi:hypothetical protein
MALRQLEPETWHPDEDWRQVQSMFVLFVCFIINVH